MTIAEPGEGETQFGKLKQALDDYFNPQANTEFQRYVFRNTRQKTDDIDDFYHELRQLADTCSFHDASSEIKSQIILGCKPSKVREKGLSTPDVTLDNLLAYARTVQLTSSQAKAIASDNIGEGVNRVKQKQGAVNRNTSKRRDVETKQHKQTTRSTRQGNKGSDHFASVCRNRQRRQRKVKQITSDTPGYPENDSDSDSACDEYTYSVSTQISDINLVSEKAPRVKIKVNDKHCTLLVDTGSSVNVIDEKTHKEIGSPKLKKRKNSRLFPYGGGKPLKVMGHCDLPVETGKKIGCHTFYVVRGNSGSLLGYSTASQLGLVKVVQGISGTHILDEFPELTQGIGKYKRGTVKIHIDETVKPVAQKPRRTPFHLRAKVEKEINKLLNDDIIEKVEGTATPWVSPIVTPPKKNPDEIRLCVDMREANKAIKRERHVLPTVDELIHDLSGASVFSKLDLISGYHQLELEPSSRYITTFSTHMGLFRYKRLNFGISSASEIFQETVHNVIKDVQGAKNISDDILVFGKTQEDHDRALHDTFEKLRDSGLTLNPEKCEFNKDKVTFFGSVFSKDGVSPDPEKVSAVKRAEPPKNVSELRSWLGMTSYSSRFIRGYASICEPLRRLTRQGEEWNWGVEQQQAFDRLKTELSSDTVITYFDPKEEIDLIVDGSPTGLGAILSQKGKTVAYASRALSDTETRYSQTEREALAVVWGCEHFDMYVRGAPVVNIITDHKPLERIWQKPKPPLRIERWGLRLQPYKLKIQYKPGSQNPADYMSRHPGQPTKRSHEEKVADQYVKFIATEAVPKAMTLDEVKMAAREDKTLTYAVEYVRTGRWHEMKNIQDPEVDIEELQSLRSVRDELITYGELLIRDARIVLPAKLRDRAIDIAHEGHQGITRTKAFLRSKIWFPGLNDKVDSVIKNCLPCQSVVYTKHREPLHMSEMPSTPWSELSADFCGPLPSGHYLLVMTDEYSRYPVVEIVHSVSSSTVIPVIDKVVSSFGVPKTIKTDNGSPFNSHAFKEYSENTGFHHRRITPRWPRANAQAEAFNKPMMKAIRTAVVEKRGWKQALYTFLRQYRSTPHTSTGYTPYRLLFGREPVTKLPHVSATPTRGAVEEHARQNDESAKMKMKIQSDRRNNAHFHTLQKGDQVLLKNETKENKLSTVYDPNPYTVVKVKGNMIQASSNEKQVTRNSSLFKKVNVANPGRDDFQPFRMEETVIRDRKNIDSPTPATKSQDNPASNGKHSEQSNGTQPEQSNGTRPKFQTQNSDITPRRSTREKRPPAYLKDFKC